MRAAIKNGLFRASCVLVFCLQLHSQPSYDWTIVPNVRVGPIQASSTPTSLQEAFGPKSIVTETYKYEHGPIGHATGGKVSIVFRNDLSRVLAVEWAGGKGTEHPRRVFICVGLEDGMCQWRTATGIGVGTSLRELEARNGRLFRLLGLEGDGSGTIRSWDGGKLEQELGSPDTFELHLRPDSWRNWEKKLKPQERRSIASRDMILSSDPALQILNPRIGSMVFYFEQR